MTRELDGRGFAAVSLAFSMEDLYGDGMNLYEYLGSNPWSRSDPLGLSWDPFSIVDDFLAERAGGSAALLSALGQETKAAAVVAATIASFLPFPFVGNIGELALFALGESSEGELAVAMALGVVPGGKLAHLFAKSGLGSFIGKIGASAWSSAKHYAGKAGSALGRRAGGLVDRARGFEPRKPPGSCCFTAGTVVWTIFGLIPIEQVVVGDIILTRDEGTKQFVFATVTERFLTEGAALLEVTVRYSSGQLETIKTTDEHPFWREADHDDLDGWVRADALTPGDQVRAVSGEAVVVRARFGSERSTVFNLTVSTSPSYLVGSNGLWVHNCPRFDAVRDYWGPMYGWQKPPQADVVVRDIRTGEQVRMKVTKEVHHRHPQSGGGTNALDNLWEVWPWEHEAIDSHRHWPYQLETIITVYNGL
ncbi:MAG: hypothetical protein KIT54_12005 [Phycisphaeraceae bacterium]|nr:hypothetical protein [Phycisphaeraceae bacterium]